MSRRQPTIAAFIALALTLALIAPTAMGPAVAASDGESQAVRLDTDIQINSPGAVDTFESKGVVHTGVTAPQMSISYAEDRDGVDAGYALNPLKGSTRNDFIRIEHKEELSRTVQIPIRADYFRPFPRDSLESLEENHTAELKPILVNGDSYTLITVTFDGKGSAVFPIPRDAQAVYSAAERTEKRTNSTFGIDLGITPSPWNQIDSDVFAGNNTTVRIEGNPDEMMIQYNAGTAADPVWLSVPDGKERNVPVFAFTRDGVEATYVVSTTSEQTELRYKREATMGDQITEATRAARELPHKVFDGFGYDLPDFDLPFIGDETAMVTPPVSVSSQGVSA